MTPAIMDKILEVTRAYGCGRDTLRCLALATLDEPLEPSQMNVDDSTKFAQIEVGMTFVGVVGMLDPPRKEVLDSIARCRAVRFSSSSSSSSVWRRECDSLTTSPGNAGRYPRHRHHWRQQGHGRGHLPPHRRLLRGREHRRPVLQRPRIRRPAHRPAARGRPQRPPLLPRRTCPQGSLLPLFYLVLPSFTQFYLVLPSFTQFYLVLPNFTEFWWSLP